MTMIEAEWNIQKINQILRAYIIQTEKETLRTHFLFQNCFQIWLFNFRLQAVSPDKVQPTFPSENEGQTDTNKKSPLTKCTLQIRYFCARFIILLNTSGLCLFKNEYHLMFQFEFTDVIVSRNMFFDQHEILYVGFLTEATNISFSKKNSLNLYFDKVLIF